MKQIFKFGTEDAEFTITMSQKNYINSISEISFSKEWACQSNDQLDEKQKKIFWRAVGQLNWVSGITRPNISFHVCVRLVQGSKIQQ